MENHKIFTVLVILPNGLEYKSREYATTKWHAIDKAYSKLSEVQPDRNQYTC